MLPYEMSFSQKDLIRDVVLRMRVSVFGHRNDGVASVNSFAGLDSD